MALPRVDYATVLRGAIIELRAEAHRRGVEAEIMEPLPSVLLRCDPLRLNRVFTNLVQNALDAVSSESPGQITLRFEVTRQEVSTELSDNGTGVPVEILPHVFEPFVTYGKAHGTGLGLAICERIVLEHNGRIFARNNSGRGAVFGFTLPIEN